MKKNMQLLTHTHGNRARYIIACVCVWAAICPTETRAIYLREECNQQSKDESDAALKFLSQSLRVYQGPPAAVHQRRPASVHPLRTRFTQMVLISVDYRACFLSKWKKTKASLNLLCLNKGDLHRCIFVCRQTWISFGFSSEAL